MTQVTITVAAAPNSAGLWGIGDEIAYNNTGVGAGGSVGLVTPDPAVVADATLLFIGANNNTGTRRFGVVALGDHPQDLFDNVAYLDAGNGNAPVSLDTVTAEFNTGPFAQSGYTTWSWVTPDYSYPAGDTVFTYVDLTAEFNCDCETVSSYSTLAQLRTRMAIQCGYAAMSSNLPPGQTAEFNEYLFTAQKQLYLKFRAQRTERFFRWTMVPGLRYYGIADSEGGCTLQLDPLGITWVGFEDLNKAWYRLVQGIDPVYYTRANINFGWPTRYEIRSCIEVFPAPQAAYTLWIKGDIGLASFTADGDRPTFDDEAVLLFAVANWKTAKGKPGAEVAMGQATQRIQDLTARKHGTARYVPSTYVQNPAVPPRFLPLGSQQA